MVSGDMLPSLKDLDKSGYALIRATSFTRLFPPRVSMRSRPCARITRCGDAAPQYTPLHILGCLTQPREADHDTSVRRGFEKTIPVYFFRHPQPAENSSHRPHTGNVVLLMIAALFLISADFGITDRAGPAISLRKRVGSPRL